MSVLRNVRLLTTLQASRSTVTRLLSTLPRATGVQCESTSKLPNVSNCTDLSNAGNRFDLPERILCERPVPGSWFVTNSSGKVNSNMILPKILPSVVQDFELPGRIENHSNIINRVLPTRIINDILEPNQVIPVVEPPSVNRPIIEKQAARLIVIRRKKMKKHKLKKLHKRTYHDWAKMVLRRETKKWNKFVMALKEKIKKANSFNAEEWVQQFLQKTKEEKPPEWVLKYMNKNDQTKPVK